MDNPVYLGKIAYGRIKTEKVKGTRDEYRRVMNDDYLLADGKHDAIIDEATWDAVRKKRAETGISWVKTHSMEHAHILSGIVKCPICGAGLSGMVNRRKNKKTGAYKDQFYYRCQHRRRLENGQKCDFKHSYRQEKLNEEVEHIVLDMVRDKNFYDFIASKMEDKVDVSNLQMERNNLREQLRQVEGAKKKLSEQMDKLDVTDRHYNRKYQDMQDRLDNLYDRIDNLEDAIATLSEKMESAYDEQISAERLYKIVRDFDILYTKMGDFEKKQFFQNFIKSIEIFPDETPDGKVLKHIDFRFPVSYEAEDDRYSLLTQNDVETVVLLSQQKPDDTIEIDLDLDELDATSAETKATYQEIKDYVLKEFGLKVSNLYISQVKRKCGIEVGENYNLPKSENARVPQCPKEKEDAIKAALKYYAMI